MSIQSTKGCREVECLRGAGNETRGAHCFASRKKPSHPPHTREHTHARCKPPSAAPGSMPEPKDAGVASGIQRRGKRSRRRGAEATHSFVRSPLLSANRTEPPAQNSHNYQASRYRPGCMRSADGTRIRNSFTAVPRNKQRATLAACSTPRCEGKVP